MNCSKCNIELNELNTYPRYNTCKSCRKNYLDIWRLTNSEYCLEQARNRPKYTCGCGAVVRNTSYDKLRHEATKKHNKI